MGAHHFDEEWWLLLIVAAAFSWVMGLMGYIRSAGRLEWHVNELMQDQSPWAYHSLPRVCRQDGNYEYDCILVSGVFCILAQPVGSSSERAANSAVGPIYTCRSSPYHKRNQHDSNFLFRIRILTVVES